MSPGMIHRMLVWFGLLVLALSVGQGFLLARLVEPGTSRLHPLLTWAVLTGIGVVLVAAISFHLTRRFQQGFTDLIEAIPRLGSGMGPRLDSYHGLQIPKLAESFNQASEDLSLRIRQLEQDREELRTILAGMVEGVVALDAEQRILYANQRAGQLLELPDTLPVGRHLWEVFRHRSLLDAIRVAQDRPEGHREDFTFPGGTRSLTVHAARLPGSPSRGMVLVLHDTTELRRLERLRQEFVANVSHELKTPLSVIKVCVETLLDGAVEDASNRGRFLEQILGQSDRLHALILDLLSLARIESGAELMQFQSIDIVALVRLMVERHRARAEARRQELLIHEAEPGLSAWADEEALEQILDNLMDNALKYTPEGGRVELRWRSSGSHLILEVSDTGIGISEADLPRIFERFYRVDRARSRELGGTGLGLAIVKHLAQAMKGSIRATSKMGEGTTFQVRLPMAPNSNRLGDAPSPRMVSS